MRLIGYITLLLLNISITMLYAYGGVMQMSGDEIRAAAASDNCMSYNKVDGFTYNKTSVSLSDNHWIYAANVEQGKKVKFEWSTIGLVSKPRKYLVLVRFDHRFNRPVVYIQKYNYDTKAYESDFHTVLGGKLEQYNTSFDLEIGQRILDFDDYVHFRNRDQIQISSGDVVNINLITAEKFFASNTDFADGEMRSTHQYLANMYTDIGDWSDNKLIYATADKLCQFADEHATDQAADTSSELCITDYSGNTVLPLPAAEYYAWLGSVHNIPLLDFAGQMTECDANTEWFEWANLCKLSYGAGINITIGGRAIKQARYQMRPLPGETASNLYYSSHFSGLLDFTAPFNMDDIYPTSNYATLSDIARKSVPSSYMALKKYISDQAESGNPIRFSKVAIGRMFFEIVIGRGTTLLSDAQNSGISIEYLFKDAQVVDPAEMGRVASGTMSTNAPITGKLFVRAVSNSDEVTGDIMVDTAAYGGHGVIADAIYNKALSPLLDKFNRVTELMYKSLVKDTKWQIIARTCMTLYIVIYALFFLAGAVEISISDLVARVVKITVVVMMFMPRSWEFFHENVFVMFMEGTAQLASKVNGATSSMTNPFGFIDPIFDRFTNRDFWALIGSQLLVFKDGLALASILVIISIIIYLLGVLEVIISYQWLW